MEHFSYRGRCSVRECTRIEAFKIRAGLGYKRLWLIINKMVRILNSYTIKNLKNEVVKQYCMHCYVTLSNVF